MSIRQIENRTRFRPEPNCQRRVPAPSRAPEDYGAEMRAQSKLATKRMAELLADDAVGYAPPISRKNTHIVPEVEEIALADAAREAECDALIARLEAMRVDNEPSKGHRIARAVAKAYGLTMREMLAKRRKVHLVKARHHAMWAMHTHTTLSFPCIAGILGGLDHTTVMHGIRRHQARIDAGEISAN